MTTNQEWLFSLTLEEYLEWMESEHYEPNPDCSAMLYKTFTGNMCSHYEPKDGVVAILREAARNLSDYHDAGEALRRLTDTLNVYHALETLADMVERDYVRRESIEEVMDNDRALVEENSMLARELLKLRAELEKATNNLNSANEDFENARAELTAERDELKGQVFTLKCECEDLENELHKLTAERDHLRRQVDELVCKIGKITDAVSELLQKQPYTFDPCDVVGSLKTVGAYIDELTAERDLLTDDDANDDSTPENGVSDPKVHITPESCRQYADQRKQGDDADCESCDSREKLEADVLAYLTPHEIAARLLDNAIFGWLDRQEAITEREWEAEQSYLNAGYKEQIAELTAERDYWKEQTLSCLIAAMKPGGYANGVMMYPLPDGYCEPSVLVTDTISSLRDFLAESEKERELYRKKQDERDELQAQADEKWNLYVAEHRRADINAADREMYREATSALVDSITDGLRKVNSILDGKDEGLA